MIIVTGGAGFIGSALVWQLNQKGLTDIVIVDNLHTTDKWRNLTGLHYQEYWHKDDFIARISQGEYPDGVQAIVHLGACSATTEQNMDYLMENNYRYTRTLAEWALSHNIRFIYASSAATYGDGALGFDDTHDSLHQLQPINRYGYSKHLFDCIALDNDWLDSIVGLKFFNVFGPNEYHKEAMRSVVCKSYQQVLDQKEIKLFKSHHPDYADGGQMRDFVYVKDCVKIIDWLIDTPSVSGIYNVGTGVSQTWNDLATAVFKAMGIPVNITYFDMPDSIRGQYQYYTEAKIDKLREAGYKAPMTPLEEAVADYVSGYLSQGRVLGVPSTS